MHDIKIKEHNEPFEYIEAQSIHINIVDISIFVALSIASAMVMYYGYQLISYLS